MPAFQATKCKVGVGNAAASSRRLPPGLLLSAHFSFLLLLQSKTGSFLLLVPLYLQPLSGCLQAVAWVHNFSSYI